MFGLIYASCNWMFSRKKEIEECPSWQRAINKSLCPARPLSALQSDQLFLCKLISICGVYLVSIGKLKAVPKPTPPHPFPLKMHFCCLGLPFRSFVFAHIYINYRYILFIIPNTQQRKRSFVLKSSAAGCVECIKGPCCGKCPFSEKLLLFF